MRRSQVSPLSESEYSGSNVKTFEIFKRICGQEVLKNVFLVSNRWNEVDEATGAARERQLRESFWAYMLGRGSCINRFHGDRSSAISLVSQLLIKDPVVLALQREMVDESKDLNVTAAGAFVDDGLEQTKEKYMSEIADLERVRNELMESDRAMRRQLEADYAKEKTRLIALEEQQVSLRRDVAEEVREEIRKGVNTKPRGLSRLISHLPTSLDLLALFVEVSDSSLDLLAEFIMEIPAYLFG